MDYRFAIVNTSGVQFWCPADASKKLFRAGTFGTKYQNKACAFSCLTFDEDGIAYTGGVNGAIHIWDQKMDLGLILKAHTADCTAISAVNGTMVSSGKDDMLSIFTYKEGEYEFLRQVCLNENSFAPTLDLFEGKILAGLDNGLLITMDLEGNNRKYPMTSHFDGEVWGLAVIPDSDKFLTCGDDNRIFEYSSSDFKCTRFAKIYVKDSLATEYDPQKKIKGTASTLSKYQPYMQGRALAYNHHTKQVAVSNNLGEVTIIDYNDFNKRLYVLKDAKEWNEVMVYSPNGEYLAVGSHDDHVYIYTVKDYKLKGTVSGASSAILCIDWTKDSNSIRFVS